MLRRVHLIRLDDAVLDSAAVLDPRVLRSLDAVHLAAAERIGTELEGVVTYDQRMAEAATLLGLVVFAPA